MGGRGEDASLPLQFRAPDLLLCLTNDTACGLRKNVLTSSKVLSRGRSVSKLKRLWAARRGGRLRSAMSSGSSRLEGSSGSSQPSRSPWTSGHRARPGGKRTHETTRPVGALGRGTALFGNSQANEIGHAPRAEWGGMGRGKERDKHMGVSGRALRARSAGGKSRWGEPGGLRLRLPNHREISYIRMRERRGSGGRNNLWVSPVLEGGDFQLEDGRREQARQMNSGG